VTSGAARIWCQGGTTIESRIDAPNASSGVGYGEGIKTVCRTQAPSSRSPEHFSENVHRFKHWLSEYFSTTDHKNNVLYIIYCVGTDLFLALQTNRGVPKSSLTECRNC